MIKKILRTIGILLIIFFICGLPMMFLEAKTEASFEIPEAEIVCKNMGQTVYKFYDEEEQMICYFTSKGGIHCTPDALHVKVGKKGRE